MFGGAMYAGATYAGAGTADADLPADDTTPFLAVEVAFTTGALEEPVWESITTDVRQWDVTRGRNRELEPFQPGRASVVLSNRDRQYDSVNTAGPHFGDLVPMRRVRIRETFNGTTFPVFDGYVDKWQLDYPAVGHDAVATVVATDGFKVLARTQLPRSLFALAVEEDNPRVWYRCDENLNSETDADLVALNYGSDGSALDGSYEGPPALGGPRLVVGDPGTSMGIVGVSEAEGTTEMGVRSPYDLFANRPFTVEAWVVPAEEEPTTSRYVFNHKSPGDAEIWLDYLIDPTFGLPKFRVFALDDASNSYVAEASGGAVPHLRYHLVVTFEDGEDLALWINRTRLGGDTIGGTWETGGDLVVGYDFTAPGSLNWHGDISQFAVYDGRLSDERINDHFDAASTPWQDDLPGVRAGRVLDLGDWPAGLRTLDDGATTLQSATLGTSVLAHLRKLADTEFGLLFMSRAGAVRLVSRSAMFARVSQATFGDTTGEVGYRGLVVDDGDEVIRNRATVSRLNGVAKTDEDTVSVTGFGRFDHVIEGLLHRSDAYSQTYADFIVDEYADPRRRVTSLDVGPAADGEAATLWPAVLGRELGDAVTVVSRPLGGGALFSQVCAIEGISHRGSPKVRTATMVLSPDFTGSF